MTEHDRDVQVGRETVLRPDAAPVAMLAEGTAPITAMLAEGTAPFAIAMIETIAEAPVIEPRRSSSRWPWISGALVVAAAGLTGYALVAERAERRDLETRFPIVADDAERDVLEQAAAAWSRGKHRLLSSLARFSPPALDTLTGAGACPLTIDEAPDGALTSDPDAAVSTRVILVPGEDLGGIDVLARDEIERMIAASERGRFRTDEGRRRILQAITGAFVVAAIADLQAPDLAPDGTITPGFATGVAYAFDPATGSLRCAGSFRATETRDLDATTIRAMAASLRAVD